MSPAVFKTVRRRASVFGGFDSHTFPPSRSAIRRLVVPALTILAVLLVAPAAAQVADTTEADEPPQAAPDTGDAVAVRDTTPGPPVTPLGAFARSFVVPGWGQAAVDKPVRGAVYFLAEAASLFMVFKSQAKLEAARRGATVDSSLVDSREEQREDWIVLSVFWALMSGVDAWVSAHLYGFEGQLTPPEDGTAGVAVRYRVPLRFP